MDLIEADSSNSFILNYILKSLLTYSKHLDNRFRIIGIDVRVRRTVGCKREEEEQKIGINISLNLRMRRNRRG
jgi:hypothetical protein